MLTHESQTHLDFVCLLRIKYCWNSVHSIWIALVTINSNSCSIAAFFHSVVRKMHLRRDVQQIWCYIRSQNLASYSILSSDGKFQSSPLSTSTLFSCNTFNFEICRGPSFRSSDKEPIVPQKPHTSMSNSDTNSLCVCPAISLRRLFICLDTCKIKPILNKYLQNVWQTSDTHCQMFVQCEWCVCCDIHFIPFTTSWRFYQWNHRCATVQYLSCYHEWLR